MKKIDVIKKILNNYFHQLPKHSVGKAFAPTNIALCKYWGKRNQELNLPVTSSLSISLGDRGATAELSVNSSNKDSIHLNGANVELSTSFGKRLVEFLNLFRNNNTPYLNITIQSNIPIAAGLASSACGFASIMQALNNLYGWELKPNELSILARLGSGSASRSIWQGFVEWDKGERDDGMDSYAHPITEKWSDLCIGLLILSHNEKGISSREAMQRTVATSPLYSAWAPKVDYDMKILKEAIKKHDFNQLGMTAESNAMTMHATMLSAWPSVIYCLPETLLAMRQVWQLRQEGLGVYFTQDAGPNLKLLFLKKDMGTIRSLFSNVEIIQLF